MRQGGKWSWLIFLPGELILNVLCLNNNKKSGKLYSILKLSDKILRWCNETILFNHCLLKRASVLWILIYIALMGKKVIDVPKTGSHIQHPHSDQPTIFELLLLPKNPKLLHVLSPFESSFLFHILLLFCLQFEWDDPSKLAEILSIILLENCKEKKNNKYSLTFSDIAIAENS